MMDRDSIETGGPAFPCMPPCEVAGGSAGGYPYPDAGMTLRDYFAAKAMQAMISKSSGQDKIGGARGVPLIAQYAYEFADALLVARAVDQAKPETP